MGSNRNYKIEIMDNILIFRTSSFKAEKGSILHSGIYSRELASFLAAGAFLTFAGFFLAKSIKITVPYFFAGIILFALLSIFFRAYLFYEASLEVVIDKGKELLTFNTLKLTGKRTELFPVSELAGFVQGNVMLKPENPDGVKVVETIALQHGTVIPGFGEEMKIYTVEIEFKQGGRKVIFASESAEDAGSVIKEMKGFLEGYNA